MADQGRKTWQFSSMQWQRSTEEWTCTLAWKDPDCIFICDFLARWSLSCYLTSLIVFGSFPASRGCLNFLAPGALLPTLIRGGFFFLLLFWCVFAYMHFLNVLQWLCVSFVIIKKYGKKSYKRILPVTLVSIVLVEWWEAEVGLQWIEKIIGAEEMETGTSWLPVNGKGNEREKYTEWVAGLRR